MKHKRRLLHLIAPAALLIGLLCTHLWACGPEFPNRVLVDSDSTLLKAPVSGFFAELKLIPVAEVDKYRAILARQPAPEAPRGGRGSTRVRTLQRDVADLRQALSEKNFGKERIDQIAGDYRKNREQVVFFSAKLDNWNFRSFKMGLDEPKPTLQADPMSQQIPKQFKLYAEGAYYYNLREKDKARQLWRSVLDLPTGERKYRSTWAAFMLAKSAPTPEEACRWYDYIFELMDQGLYDSLGLGLTGIGQKGRIALDQKDHIRAINLYLLQYHLDDPTAGASLQTTVGWAFSQQTTPKMLARIAADKTARRVFTAYIASRGGAHRDNSKEYYRKWLKAVEDGGLGIIEDAGRLAMIAYQSGNMDIAEHWTRFGTEDDLVAQWIAAKLQLRKGNISRAAERLAGVCRSFAPAVDPHPKYALIMKDLSSGWGGRSLVIDPAAKNARGELGILLLSQSQYIEALDVLLAGGLWTDAAYVAEYVLQPDELKHYVDRAWPEICPQDTDTLKTESEWIRRSTRYLLARRLTRIGRWQEARPYYPEHLRERLDVYVNAIRAGHDESLSAADRAANLWKAARIARHEGLQLLATEVEPDWFAFSANFQPAAASKIRLKNDPATIAPPSDDERDRISRHRTEPDKRWHYRYTAADHAWRAATRMPDESDETAKVLCIAGSW
ncbi:MAG: hypothetical protein J7M40_01075, partial [Planctomycetes bacterium]|nr:hypothetical protein [Planctomycetota bacterium]